METNPESTYIRLVSIPCEIPYALPEGYALEKGKGVVVRSSAGQCVIFAYGPTMLSQAWHAAGLLAAEYGLEATVVNLPWLNYVDTDWLRDVLKGAGLVVTVDDHYRTGGQGEMLAAALAEFAADLSQVPRLLRIGLDEIPRCGQNPEVLAYHELDAKSLAAKIAAARG